MMIKIDSVLIVNKVNYLFIEMNIENKNILIKLK